ncbi:MAG: threonine synthase [Caulobacteraceae bacterium]|nr:threonine synthase [Caulobacteraceae bacterium]
MRYVSTRGAAPPVSFVEAVLAGLAPDGGLYVPDRWPTFSAEAIAGVADIPYAQAAAQVLGAFAGGEIDAAELEAMCAAAYATFEHAAVAPLRQLSPDRWLLELFHGPSLAFKDVALQLLARLYEHILQRQGRRLTIVCATSGDTGGAAVEALRGRANIRLVVMFPEGRISDIQRRFMTTAPDANVATVAVDGDFDDCQRILKSLFRDQVFAREVSLAAVNSINFARLAAQSVYYFTSAAALGGPERPVAFAVPTGNFGDAFAGWMARAMGLPVSRIIAATNANDILARALTQGRYARASLAATESPAMDIQSASNFERLMFEAAGRDADATRRLFEGFDQSGDVALDPAALRRAGEVFTGVSASDAEGAQAMRASLASGGVVDPHTAIAIAGLRKVDPLPKGPLVVLSTAHPAKFPEAVSAATGAPPPTPPAAARVHALSERFDRIAADVAAVKAYVRAFATQ